MKSSIEVTVLDPAALKHRRARKSHVALCGTPAKQDQITDDLEFDCPRCWAAMTAKGKA
jgi:hypothetical protein